MKQQNNTNQVNNINLAEGTYCAPQNGQYYDAVNYYASQITARDWIEIQKYEAKKQINEHYEARRLDGLEKYRQRKQAERLVVFRDWGGHFFYYFGTRESPGTIFDLIPNSSSIKTTIFRCRDREEEVLEVAVCKGKNEVKKCIIIDEKIAAKLDRILKTEGVGINVKNSLKGDALQQLSILLMNDSKIVYLPTKAGWNEDKDGNFMFIVPGVQTFKEVFRNAL